jgi:hypothetical protein
MWRDESIVKYSFGIAFTPTRAGAFSNGATANVTAQSG